LESLAEQPAVAGDGLPEKLVKYVPAETLAFFVPLAAAAGTDREGFLIALLVIGIIGTVAYLWYAARALPAGQRPLIHFYVLAPLAFLCWAIATAPNVAELIGIDSLIAATILTGAVFLIPITDSIVTWLLTKRS
jgi:hypothetical protein